MSWITKVSFFLAPMLVCASAMAQRMTFAETGDDRAQVQTRALEAPAGGLAPVEVTLSIPSIDIERTGEGFDAVRVDGLVPLNQPGMPDLKGTGALIAVPAGFEPRLTVVRHESREVTGVVAQPMQRKFRCGGGKESFEFRADQYRSNGLYPAKVVELEEAGKLQDVRLMRVALRPFQMDFANSSLRVATDLAVRVDFVQTSRAGRLTMAPSMLRLVRSTVANGASLDRFVTRSQDAELMVIVTADNLKQHLEKFVAWKAAKGLKVQVATFTEAGGTKEKVKAFVQKIYDDATVKPSYLLFVGNKKTMPVFMESTDAGNAASDYRYALLSGSDDVPDALYGRLVAEDAKDVEVQISRWIEYEKSPERGTWFHDATTIASPEGSGPSDQEYAESIAEALKKGTYKEVDPFFNADKNATPANVTKAVNEGRSWIAYFGHGTGTSWPSTNGSFTNDHVAKLENDTRLPVIIDVACMNAAWATLPKPFAKAWVTHQVGGRNAGAVAFYGGSVNISWHPPAVMSVGVAKSHFEKPVYSLGGSVLAGQLYLIEQMGTGSDTLDNMKWYNLLGDPSLLVRTDVPRAYTVKSKVDRFADRVEVTVRTVDDNGKAVSGVLASLDAGAAAPLAVGQTDKSGEALLVVSGVNSLGSSTRLVTTGYNLESYDSDVR